MNRHDVIRSHLDKTMRLIELGASYNPVIPKADGWNTTVIDHASQADLIARYSGMGMEDVGHIEPVDFVWQDGPLSDLVPQALHGTFDGIVASHVGEHFPDLIAFFKSASLLLKPSGIMALALPDKRVCFDFFQPLTMTGDLVDAHFQRRTSIRRPMLPPGRNAAVGPMRARPRPSICQTHYGRRRRRSTTPMRIHPHRTATPTPGPLPPKASNSLY